MASTCFYTILCIFNLPICWRWALVWEWVCRTIFSSHRVFNRALFARQWGSKCSRVLLPLFSLLWALQFCIHSIFWVKFIEKNPLSTLGFVKKNWLKYLGWGILLSLLQMGVIALVYQLGGIGSFELNELSLEPILFILGLFPFWLLQGGTEEVATRGWLLTRIAARTNLPLAIAISSSLFGFLHLGNSGVTFLSVLNIVLDGVLAGLLLIYTDSIWLVVAQHGTWNYVQGNLLGFQVSGTGADASIFSFTMGSGPDWLTGGAFGAEGSIITTLVLLVSLVIVYRLGERKEKFDD